ncbi:MAG: DUF4388 domain-containing protein, partial [Deltaproteobacteria bacterium]|nr:DUF4388 domain-containing protein [Deltaproteobacteria bacterium]MBW1738349.1 DUF4388 domain-containing protein [Deltaproteobacteria bacterium]
MNGNSVLKGDLRFLSLSDVLQILGENNKTGTLRIRSQYAPKAGLIYFMNGNPVNAIAGQLNGLDAIYSLFGWTQGKFELHEEEVRVRRVVNKSTIQIIMDGLRMFDDGLIKILGPSINDTDSALKGQDKREGSFIVKGPRVDYMYIVDEEQFADGEKIFKEGAHGNWIWIILEGMVKVSKKTKKGPLTIVRLGEGCFLGTLTCLAHGVNRRSATVTAIGDVSLGLLDSQRLSGDFACLSPDFKGLLLSLDDRLRKISGRAVNLFVKKHDINEFIEGQDLIPVRDTLEENVFYIKKGEVYVIKRTPSGDLPLITLEKNDAFGYVPFMNISPELPFTSLLASKDLKLGKL